MAPSGPKQPQPEVKLTPRSELSFTSMQHFTSGPECGISLLPTSHARAQSQRSSPCGPLWPVTAPAGGETTVRRGRVSPTSPRPALAKMMTFPCFLSLKQATGAMLRAVGAPDGP